MLRGNGKDAWRTGTKSTKRRICWYCLLLSYSPAIFSPSSRDFRLEYALSSKPKLARPRNVVCCGAIYNRLRIHVWRRYNYHMTSVCAPYEQQHTPSLGQKANFLNIIETNLGQNQKFAALCKNRAWQVTSQVDFETWPLHACDHQSRILTYISTALVQFDPRAPSRS